MRKRVLILSSYPIVNPQHGGQKRVKALVGLYERVFDDVKFISVFHKASYPDNHATSDIPLGQIDNLDEIDEKPYLTDQVIGKSIDNDSHVRSQMAKVLRDYEPDIIHIEQPYLYEGLSVLLKELNLRPRLIFGTQTVEYKMKRDIYRSINVSKQEVSVMIDHLETLEKAFAKAADLVIAINKDEADEYKKMGAKNIAIAPNGISVMSSSKKEITYWKNFKRDNKINRIITFIGSGHPPNYLGFNEMFGSDSGFLPKGVKIILAGGVSEYYTTVNNGNKIKSENYNKFWKNVVPVGKLSESRLAALIRSSDAILLPITSGGGSNLKTAEAIIADKNIIATDYAFRGFEQYRKLPNMYIGNTKKDFHLAISEAVGATKVKRTKDQAELAQTVDWMYCLEPLIPFLKNVSRSNYGDVVEKTAVYYKRLAGRLMRRLGFNN